MSSAQSCRRPSSRERRTFQAAALAGRAGVADLVATMGYYDLVSMALNVIGYPLPMGVLPWPEPE